MKIGVRIKKTIGILNSASFWVDGSKFGSSKYKTLILNNLQI